MQQHLHVKQKNNTILITGGLGFIGWNFVELLLEQNHNTQLIIFDAKTSAAQQTINTENYPRVSFIHANINHQALLETTLQKFKPDAVIHFAAETHVDHSINNPKIFVESNINGTFHLLEASLKYWENLSLDVQHNFRFIHISTDEVYGSLNINEQPFTENSNYAPNNPYAASKAASDHLVRAYCKTYGLPTIITHCSNNYGPYQHQEKLIPKMIFHALHGKPLPIYGNGQHIRDWLYVKDHCLAILSVLTLGKVGETYNIGGNQEKSNLEIVQTICAYLDKLRPKQDGTSYQHQIQFVEDRLGHDTRYAINHQKISQALEWQPSEHFESGIKKTIDWYLQHFNTDNH